jgi:hypothetical protein
MNVEGLENDLMDHFLADTLFTLPLIGQQPAAAVCHPWPELVPGLASQCHFARQSILAVSAIHLCLLNDLDHSRKYFMLAHRYSIEASREFRASVRDISQHNWLPTIVFSVQAAIFGLCAPFLGKRALPGREDDGDKKKRMAPFNPTELILIMRSTAVIVPKIDRFLAQSSFWQYAAAVAGGGQDQAGDFQSARNDTMMRLSALKQKLTQRSAASPNGDAIVRAYMEAIHALENWILTLSGPPTIWKHFVTWPSMLPEDYLDQLRANCSVALEILACWCGIMKQVPSRWFLSPWLETASDMVGTESSI